MLQLPQNRALVTVDGESIDWTTHSKDDEDYALMANNNSGSEIQVYSCSSECKKSYANLKRLYDAQREQLSDASVELKDVEDTDRPRPTSKRSTLTLKPLPKIDPKDKGKKKIEEEDETEMQEEWEAEEESNKIAEEQAINLRLESEEESTMALELIRFIKK
ncbi:hypothetical protein Tco_0239389, partial [Tanacetum coccineum]